MGAPNELLRVPLGPGRCAWCGTQRKTLYGYAGESSGGWRTKEALRGARGGKGFCNTGCFRDYHGISRSGYDYVDKHSHRDNPRWSKKKIDAAMMRVVEFDEKYPHPDFRMRARKGGEKRYQKAVRAWKKRVSKGERRNPPSGKPGDYLAEVLHPSRFTQMSPKMAAILSYILGQKWTNPAITNAVVTSDGYVMIWRTDVPHKEGLFSTIIDLRDNLSRLVKSAELSANEQKSLEALFRRKVPRA